MSNGLPRMLKGVVRSLRLGGDVVAGNNGRKAVSKFSKACFIPPQCRAPFCMKALLSAQCGIRIRNRVPNTPSASSIRNRVQSRVQYMPSAEYLQSIKIERKRTVRAVFRCSFRCRVPPQRRVPFCRGPLADVMARGAV